VLLAGGAALALWAGSHVWVHAAVHHPGVVTAQRVRLSGGEVAGAAGALAYAVLAGAAVVVVTRGWVRLVAGGLAAALGVLVAVSSVLGITHLAGPVAAAASAGRGAVDFSATVSWWWLGSLAGGVLAAGGGTLAAWRGRRWPAMGARYGVPERQRRATANPAASAWDALDRGEDPTL
jgi:uncharacterized membrane protein (TIGR02234 family)